MANPVIDEDETKVWYNDKGQVHREDGPAVETTTGDKAWYKNGERHRDGGPAVEHNKGTKLWYKNGERHREDGPAVEVVNGYNTWWVNGKMLTEEEFNKWRLKKNLKELLQESHRV